MKGIFRIINPRSTKIWKYYAIDDIEKIDQTFHEILQKDNRLRHRDDYNQFIPELVETTEDVNRRLAFYTWPQLSRVTYNDKCFDYPIDKKYSKIINGVVNWLIQAYIAPDFTFLIDTPNQY